MSKIIDINEGYTNNYLVYGIFTILGSPIFLIISIYLTLIVGTIGVCFFLMTNGLEIDTISKKYRKYGSFFGIKSGTWENFPACKEIRLVLSSERIKLFNAFPMMVQIGNRSSKSMTYDILLFSEDIEKPILMYEFLKYKNAQIAFGAVSSNFNISGRDLVLEKIGQRRGR